MELIHRYIHPLSENQQKSLTELLPLYQFWNAQINVISRKDMDSFILHHVLHSLTLTRFTQFKPGTKIIDLGCGGGFPGIPLAIFYPEVEFILIDSIGKKIKVVHEVCKTLNLQNVTAHHCRVEDCKEKVQFIVTRAVASLQQLLIWSQHRFDKKEMNALPNGLIAYKGGNLQDELNAIKNTHPYEVWNIHDKIPENYFTEKFLIYVQK